MSGVTDLSLIDATHAIPVIVDSGCHHHKSDCYNHTYLAATNDSGRTWQTIQASPDAGRANAQNTQRQPAATGPGSAQYSAGRMWVVLPALPPGFRRGGCVGSAAWVPA